MDFQTLKSRVAELLGNDSSAMLTKIGNWLNMVQQDFAHNIKFQNLMADSTVVSVIGTQTYALPANLDNLEYIVWQGDVPRKLTQITHDTYDLNVPQAITSNDNGQPEVFFIHDTNFSVYAVPNQVANFIVHFYKVTTDMSEPTDLPSIPTRHHHDLIWGAYYWGKQYEQDKQGIQLAVQDYQNVIRRVRVQERKSRRYQTGMSSAQDLRTIDENNRATGR